MVAVHAFWKKLQLVQPATVMRRRFMLTAEAFLTMESAPRKRFDGGEDIVELDKLRREGGRCTNTHIYTRTGRPGRIIRRILGRSRRRREKNHV